jgi:hypothetical protein
MFYTDIFKCIVIKVDCRPDNYRNFLILSSDHINVARMI